MKAPAQQWCLCSAVANHLYRRVHNLVIYSIRLDIYTIVLHNIVAFWCGEEHTLLLEALFTSHPTLSLICECNMACNIEPIHKKTKENTMLLGVIHQEELIVSPSLPLTETKLVEPM